MLTLTLQNLVTVLVFAFVARVGWTLGRRVVQKLLGRFLP